MNDFIICKSIKIEVPIKENQNTHKGKTKTPIKGIIKIPIKKDKEKPPSKNDNKNKTRGGKL